MTSPSHGRAGPGRRRGRQHLDSTTAAMGRASWTRGATARSRSRHWKWLHIKQCIFYQYSTYAILLHNTNSKHTYVPCQHTNRNYLWPKHWDESPIVTIQVIGFIHQQLNTSCVFTSMKHLGYIVLMPLSVWATSSYSRKVQV